MSSRSAKQIGGKPTSTGSDAIEDLTDWARVEAMDDEDIVYDEDSPPLPDDFWVEGQFRKGGRPATDDEIAEFLEKVEAYSNRPRKTPAK
ncbi:hypothetical protein [Massilia endophytica]|uniref:hypothetical protein n=1 Tax=Massilia endophytica TaxID=2899220 RepID=UPI001E5D4AB4|nr:hypothetical protein [Massilia endophytica]UGQ49344.1 hypothetical protein LSQ66_13145 [Massilia endophytica]